MIKSSHGVIFLRHMTSSNFTSLDYGVIFAIIVMCLYLYSVRLVYQILSFFNLSVVASKYRTCYMESNTSEFKLRSMFKHNPDEKDMVYDPQWKRQYGPN